MNADRNAIWVYVAYAVVAVGLTAWLASRRVLLTELRAGSRSLEQAFLTLTTDEGDAATTPLER